MEPDLIIADLSIPGRNAIEVISELRNNCPNKLPAILIISGHKITENLLLEAGLTFQNFIQKPFSKGEISSFVKRCVQLC